VLTARPSDFRIDAGEIDLLVEPAADLVVATVRNEVRAAADTCAVTRPQLRQPIAAPVVPEV